MKKLFIICVLLCLGCKEKQIESPLPTDQVTHITHDHYQLFKSSEAKALLIVFPGGGTTSKETRADFNIVAQANSNGISVLLMNFNRHLWINDQDASEIKAQVDNAIQEHNLDTDNIVIGGMSVGGNVALSFSGYLHRNQDKIAPNGVFIVDSPIDLNALYESSLVDIANPNLDAQRLEEPKWIVDFFETEFTKDSLVANIQKVSPFTLANKFTSVGSLKNSKIRFYTEPDTLWLEENRQTKFEYTNAYSIQQVSKDLQSKNWDGVELIETVNKGYRSNGERNPHSWSIVDVDQLIAWILE